VYSIYILTGFYLFSAGLITAEENSSSSFSLEEALLGHWVAKSERNSWENKITLHYYFDQKQCSIMSEELVKDGGRTNTKIRLIHFHCRKISSSGDRLIIKKWRKPRRGFWSKKNRDKEYAYRLTFSPDRDQVTYESIKYHWKQYLTYVDDETVPPIDTDQIIKGEQLIDIGQVLEEEEIITGDKEEIEIRDDVEDRSHLSARQALLGHWQTPSRGFELYFQRDVFYRVSPVFRLSTPTPVGLPTPCPAKNSLIVANELNKIRKDSLKRNISATGYSIILTDRDTLKFKNEYNVYYDQRSNRLKKTDIFDKLDIDTDVGYTKNIVTFSNDRRSFTWQSKFYKNYVRYRGHRIKLPQIEPIEYFYVDDKQKPDKH
jgi:hypothetical protein